MKGKIFYIPGNHKVVKVLVEEKDYLICGGLSEYISDANTNILRQKITKEDFNKYRPKELDENNLDSYKFLQKYKDKTYKVRDIYQENYFSSTFKLAEQLPSATRTNWNFPVVKYPN